MTYMGDLVHDDPNGEDVGGGPLVAERESERER